MQRSRMPLPRRAEVSILTRPERRMQRIRHEVNTVSILTRPERRMQRGHPGDVVNVSILTRPERRMQRGPPGNTLRGRNVSDPHPPREADATSCPATLFAVGWTFQSSPAPRGGCNMSDPRIDVAIPVKFQSSPAPRGGCNNAWGAYVSWRWMSNPHPPREADATLVHLTHCLFQSGTRPERRMQQRLGGVCQLALDEFQSSPAPRGGCNALQRVIAANASR